MQRHRERSFITNHNLVKEACYTLPRSVSALSPRPPRQLYFWVLLSFLFSQRSTQATWASLSNVGPSWRNGPLLDPSWKLLWDEGKFNLVPVGKRDRRYRDLQLLFIDCSVCWATRCTVALKEPMGGNRHRSRRRPFILHRFPRTLAAVAARRYDVYCPFALHLSFSWSREV